MVDRVAVNYLALLHVLGFSWPKLGRLLRAGDVVAALADGDVRAALAALTGSPQSAVDESLSWAGRTYGTIAGQSGGRCLVVPRTDGAYPAVLRDLPGAPPILFCRGDLGLLSRPCIAVVGTRGASEAGTMRARRLALLLAERGFVIASGLAKGIDTAAHAGALAAGGRTLAVIGTSLDRCYPAENKELQEAIACEHLVVSQFPYGHPVKPWSFPLRNWLMSALSAATVIVEAGDTSGAVIQGRQALAQGRPLFMLRSILDNPRLSWPGKFLAAGARVVEQVEDVLGGLSDLTVPRGQGRLFSNGGSESGASVCGRTVACSTA